MRGLWRLRGDVVHIGVDVVHIGMGRRSFRAIQPRMTR